MLLKPIPDVEEELGELLLGERRAIDAYPFPHGNQVRGGIEAYAQLDTYFFSAQIGSCSPTFHPGFACRMMESVKADVDPLPFVPVI